MSHRAKELEQARKVKERLRMVQHYEQVTHNVSRDLPVLWDLPHPVLPRLNPYRK